MPLSDEELAEKAAGVQKLREELAKARADREARQQAIGNDLTADQLDAEAERLQLELDREETLKDLKSPTEVSANSLEGAQTAMEAAAEAENKSVNKSTVKPSVGPSAKNE
jgi:SOS response regulatory protein OraA/RecX